jgi:hypothetical protein
VLAEGEQAVRRKWMGGGVEPQQISGCWKKHENGICAVLCGGRPFEGLRWIEVKSFGPPR